jgi:hypothetical protein
MPRQKTGGFDPSGERRSALVHLSWPPSLKRKARELEDKYKLSVNELSIRAMIFALENEQKLVESRVPIPYPYPATPDPQRDDDAAA